MACSTAHSVHPFLLPILSFLYNFFLHFSLFLPLFLPAATQGHEDSSIEWSARARDCVPSRVKSTGTQWGILPENCKSVFDSFEYSL